MKLYSIEEFLKLPAGTLYYEYNTESSGLLRVKGPDPEASDEFPLQYSTFINALDSTDLGETMALRDAFEAGAEVATNFDLLIADPEANEDVQYAVFSRIEIAHFLQKLLEAEEAAKAGEDTRRRPTEQTEWDKIEYIAQGEKGELPKLYLQDGKVMIDLPDYLTEFDNIQHADHLLEHLKMDDIFLINTNGLSLSGLPMDTPENMYKEAARRLAEDEGLNLLKYDDTVSFANLENDIIVLHYQTNIHQPNTDATVVVRRIAKADLGYSYEQVKAAFLEHKRGWYDFWTEEVKVTNSKERGEAILQLVPKTKNAAYGPVGALLWTFTELTEDNASWEERNAVPS